jgi:hypothetical protein
LCATKPKLGALLMKTQSVLSTIFFLVCSFNAIAEAMGDASIINEESKKVIILVQKAKDYIKAYGKEKAMAEFNKKSGKFSEKASYIFALDYDSVYLATINYPELIGKNQFNLKDPLRTSTRVKYQRIYYSQPYC